MQPACLSAYCSSTDRTTNFTDPGHTATTPDHGRYEPTRPDCAEDGNDVTSSRDRQSSSSSSSQSMDDVNVARSSLIGGVSPTYVDRTSANFDAPVSDVTSGHNG